ncbi:MAG: DNA polymerase II large subunit [Nanoarchaeota archaeon]|nr:DNA polymerase II large subunit [Nanoarchaeota archaeon]
MNTEQYFEHIEKEVKRYYDAAREARRKGFDPVSDVETPIAMTLAEKATGLISTIYPQLNDKKIIDRIIELEKEFGPLDMMVPFKIAEEIAKEKFCKFASHLQAMDAGIRVGFSYITIGVVSSPIEGFTELKIKKTKEGKEYLAAYFSGPIRSAGTTASCMVLMLIDYLREVFGYDKYDPSEDEVKRYVTENYDYHERINNLQYLPTEEEIEFLARNIPIEVTGEPSEDREVSNYKDLQRIETNFIRGGMCLIFSEGLAQKAQKGYGLWKGMLDKGLQATGWRFLDQYIQIHKKRVSGSSDTSATYIKDLVAGRPVFGHPSRSGGFRFRYGRGRVGGFSATAIHPATMGISGSFMSFGTQLKIEKPTKGCAIAYCDEMDGPIVKLNSGSVKRIETLEEAKRVYPNVEEIVYLGDILISLGDVANRKYELLKPGYVEEWWNLELEKKAGDKKPKLNSFQVSFEEACKLSREFGIPLHPRYIYYWKEISSEQFLALVEWIREGKLIEGDRLVLPYFVSQREIYSMAKRGLELLGCEHEVTLENVVLQGNDVKGLLANLGIPGKDLQKEVENILIKIEENKDKSILEKINLISEFTIKDKSGVFIGARMGRPEKAKLRKLTGSPHVLFPVGEEGGRMRSVQSALEIGKVNAEFPLYQCKECGNETIYPRCEKCSAQCMKLKYSPKEDKIYMDGVESEETLIEYKGREVDIKHYFELARKQLGFRNDEVALIKGVKGTSSKDHSCEHLGKGILRAKYGLNVNKDGTIRYDMTEMAITHFKPLEIGTSIPKLKQLGYEKDVFGNELMEDNQILEMFPHDVILPSCPDSPDERADAVFTNISNFVDDEFEKIYSMPRFFNIQKKEDLLGSLLVCIAPHICTATVGRLIGYSESQTLLASPFMHAAMRRDCDGDEAAALFLMDLLLNFSKKFLPAHRGGTQDAPLVLNVRIRAGDVDDQILDFELSPYPLELYELAEQGKHSSEVKIDNVKSRLKAGKDPFSGALFTHNSDNFNHTVLNSSYKSLPTMGDKVRCQMELCKKIRAVDTRDVSRLIIERHLIRDTRGNLRKFSQQEFRCVGCNGKYRRPPMAGKCNKCGGRLIFTIAEGSVLKYMQLALSLARDYKVDPYLLESLELTERYIYSIFGKEKDKQEALGKWF